MIPNVFAASWAVGKISHMKQGMDHKPLNIKKPNFLRIEIL